MKVAYVTAGAAGMFCGSCMQDNTLVKAVRELGCDAVLVPTFTPIRTDEDDVSIDRVHLGGVNLYLQQRWPAYRHVPRVVKRWLDRPGLLRGVSRLALQTRRTGDGALALSLLRGEHGGHREAHADLVDWLAGELRPDLVHLSNLLIAGFVPALRRRLDVPVLVTLQGDDAFVDSLPEPEAAAVLHEMRRVARDVDGFVVHAEFYGDRMAGLLELPRERFHRVRLGLAEPERFAPPDRSTRPGAPTVGYLARICPEKGFGLLIDAFLRLRTLPGTEHAQLRVGGWLGPRDQAFYELQQRKAEFTRVPLPDRDAKIRFLHELDVFTVPTLWREPKGLFVLEALAAGVPAVLPDHGCFPEMARETGGVRLVPPGDAGALAGALHELLGDVRTRRRLGDEARRRVSQGWNARAAASVTLELWRRFV